MSHTVLHTAKLEKYIFFGNVDFFRNPYLKTKSTVTFRKLEILSAALQANLTNKKSWFLFWSAGAHFQNNTERVQVKLQNKDSVTRQLPIHFPNFFPIVYVLVIPIQIERKLGKFEFRFRRGRRKNSECQFRNQY